MKKLNMFTRLPKEDQTLVLDLCDKLPYRAVVEKLALPRDQGGLSMVTSESSLSKFLTRHHPEAFAIEAIGQYAAAVQVQQQAHGEPNFEAILGLVQNRILAALRNGKSVADLDKDFRSLARVQKCFLADVKYRHKNDHVTDAYLEHVKAVARDADEAEFIRNDVEDDPGAGAVTIEDFQEELSQYKLDLFNAQALSAPEISRTTTFLRGAARIVAARKVSDRQRAWIASQTGKPCSLTVQELDAISGANPAQLLAMMKANAATAAAANPHQQPATSDTPLGSADSVSANPILRNPKGIPPQSPTLRGTRYVGSTDDSDPTATRLRPSTSTIPFPPEISDPDTPKTPAISHLSPNFASPNSGNPT